MRSTAEHVLSLCGEAGSCNSQVMMVMQMGNAVMRERQNCTNEAAMCTGECKITACKTINWVKSCCNNASPATSNEHDYGSNVGEDMVKMMCDSEGSSAAEGERMMESMGCPCDL